jgi:hypothetical protein
VSNSLIVVSPQATVNDASTVFFTVTGQFTSRTTEAQAETLVRDAGVFSNLWVNANQNDINASPSATFTLRKSRADTTLIVSYGANETGIKEDTVNTVTFAATDEIDWEATASAVGGAHTIALRVAGVQFAPTVAGDSVQLLAATNTLNFSTASASNYFVPCGASGTQATENNTKYRVRATFTASDFYVFVSANARTTDSTYRTRKDGANGGQSVTYASAETGAKEDTSGSDSLVSGSDFNFQLSTGTGTGTITSLLIGCSLINTSSIFPLLSSVGAGLGQAFNVTTFYSPAGSLNNPSVTESNNYIYPRFTFTASELVTFVSANTITTSASVFTVRDNLGDSAITVSYAAAETGLKNNSSNTAEITTGADEISYKVATPNTSGTLTVTYIGVLGTASAPTPFSEAIFPDVRSIVRDVVAY